MTTAGTLQNAVLGELVDSTPLLRNPKALRARAQEDGYLFFRRYLPTDAIRALRHDLLRVVERFGWLRPGQDPLGGSMNLEALNAVPADQMRVDIGVSAHAYDESQKLESLHSLPHHPSLLALYEQLFDRDVLVHPRHIVRMMTAHDVMEPIPTHQDYPLVQGSGNTWTCWAPLGTYPTELGGLAVLRASHRGGYLPVMPAAGAGGVQAQLCDENDWLTTDYECGDVLTFASYTVHKGTECTDTDQIRLSLDARYQPADEPVEVRSLNPHCNLTWDEVYRDWGSTRYQYYWTHSHPELMPWNPQLLQPSRRIC